MAMPIAWQVGYRWAGSATEVDCVDYAEQEGIVFGTPEFLLFLAGAEAFQDEAE